MRPRIPRRARRRVTSLHRPLVIAGAVGLGVAGMLLLVGSGPAARSEVLVARVGVPAGTPLDDAELARDFAVVRVSGGHMTGLVASPAQVQGRRLAEDLALGEPLTVAALGGGRAVPAPLAPGERAVPVAAEAVGAMAHALQPGGLVDVVSSSGEGPSGRTRVVVAGAEVLAVDPGGDTSTGGPADGGVVLLRATQRDALRITAVLNFARDVRLLARPVDEAPGHPGPAVSAP